MFKKTLSLYVVYFIACLVLSGLFYYAIAPYLNITEKSIYIAPLAWLIEVFIVFLMSLLILLITRRQLLTLIISLFLYVLFLLINVVKIQYLQTPLYPVDFMQVGDLFKTWELFKTFLPFLILAIILIFVGLKIGYQKEQPKQKGLLFTAMMTLILVFSIGYYRTDIDSKLRTIGIYHKKNANLARRGLKYGYLTNFTQALLFAQSVKQPKNYSIKEIERLIKKYQLDTFDNNKIDQPDNVIVLLVEAFTDPLEMGWQYTQDPIPSFRKAQQEFGDIAVFSPVYGGKSINAEFELMTGMSNRFTPIESMPYQEFVDQKIPGLVDSFVTNGYTTNTLQVIRFKGFGYGKIYDYLGVDHKISLADKEKYQLDPTGTFTSSDEIAKKILEVTDRQQKSFLFAFPNSTHSPWYLDDYPNTQILLSNGTVDQALNDEISAYLNALRHTDKLLQLLMSGYQKRDEKTLIIMLGDHQPGLRQYNDHYLFDQQQSEYANNILKSYRVPMAIWSNYSLKNISEKELSMNLLSSYVLDLADIPINGFMKFNNIMRKEFSVFSHLIKSKFDDTYHQEVPENLKSLADDYQMLQYDLLFGEQYLKKRIN